MEQLLEKYNSLYKQEFIEDEDNETIFTLKQYDFKTPIEYTKTNILNENVRNDIEFNENENSNNLYSHLFRVQKTKNHHYYWINGVLSIPQINHFKG